MIIAVGIANCIHAQESMTQPEQAQPAPDRDQRWAQLFSNRPELSLDLFGIGTLHENDFNNGARARHDIQGGGGAGLNLFLDRYVGVGGDFFSISWGHSFVDTTTGNIILRVPVGPVAPYIFGGAGYQFQGIDQVVGGGGVGIEFRPAPHFGIFVDARYLAAAKTDGFGVGRAGIRLSF